MQGNYSVNFHPNAEKEFIASMQWYGHSRKDLGNEFMIGIRKVIDLIELNPILFPIKIKILGKHLLRNSLILLSINLMN